MPHQTALLEAIRLTDDILGLLESGEFDQVSELELRRQPLIRQAFSDSIEQIDAIKARHLQNLNHQVVDRLNQFKQSVLAQQSSLRMASKASRAYQGNCAVAE